MLCVQSLEPLCCCINRVSEQVLSQPGIGLTNEPTCGLSVGLEDSLCQGLKVCRGLMGCSGGSWMLRVTKGVAVLHGSGHKTPHHP